MNLANWSYLFRTLKKFLDSDWNIVVHKNTTTRQRIIGDVTVHHRPKFLSVYDNTSCSR